MIGDYAINSIMLIQFTYDRIGRNICCCFLMPHLSVTLYFPCSSPFPPLLYPSYLCYSLLPFIFISTLRPQKNACEKGCVMDQAIRFQPLNMEAWIWSQTSPYGIYGGKSGTETVFFLSTLVFPCIIAALPHILISFIYHWCMSSTTESAYVFLSHELKPSILPWIY